MSRLIENVIWKKHAIWAYLATLVVVTIAVNINTLANEFVWDDIPQILDNRWITDTVYLKDIFTNNVAGFETNSATSYYRPLMYVFFIGIYKVCGLASWAWHLTNVLLHAGVVIVLFQLVRQLFQQIDDKNSQSAELISFVAALLFAVHPIHSEAVAWISAMPELSYSLFYLLAVWLYLRTRPDNGVLDANYVASLSLYFLAMLCKEPAITMPLIIIAFDYASLKKLHSLPFRRYLPYFAVACLYLLVRHFVLGGMAPSQRFQDLSIIEIAINGPVLFSQYLGKLLLPINLTAIYANVPVKSLFAPTVFIGILVSTAFGVFMWVARHNRQILPCLVLIIVPILPVLYIPAMVVSIFAERYLYLPSAGFVILLSLGLNWLLGKSLKTAATALTIVILASYSAGTIVRNRVWKDSLTLWGDTVKKASNRANAHSYYGYALYQAGLFADAEIEYRKAIAIDGNHLDAYINLGIVYHKVNRFDEAIQTYHQALLVAPKSVMVYKCLGAAYQAKGDMNEAMYALNSGVQLNPNDAELHNSLGKLYANMERFNDSSREFRLAVELNPANQEYLANLNKVMTLQRQ